VLLGIVHERFRSSTMRHLPHAPLLSGLKPEVTTKVTNQLFESLQRLFNLRERFIKSAAYL
jgi:hypothetical protein